MRKKLKMFSSKKKDYSSLGKIQEWTHLDCHSTFESLDSGVGDWAGRTEQAASREQQALISGDDVAS